MEGEVNLGMIWNVLLSLHARRVRQLMWCGRKKRHFLDGQPGDPGKCQKQRRRLKLINFLLRPDVAKQVAETTVIQRQTLRRVSC